MNAPPPDDIQNASEGSMRPGQDLSIDPEKAAALEARVAAKPWSDGDKKSFLDTVLGRGK